MVATKEDIRYWFLDGVCRKATHMIVVCDTYDYSDYPVYVLRSENIKDEIRKRDGVNMQKIMEVYNLSMDMENQLSEFRAKNL